MQNETEASPEPQQVSPQTEDVNSECCGVIAVRAALQMVEQAIEERARAEVPNALPDEEAGEKEEERVEARAPEVKAAPPSEQPNLSVLEAPFETIVEQSAQQPRSGVPVYKPLITAVCDQCEQELNVRLKQLDGPLILYVERVVELPEHAGPTYSVLMEVPMSSEHLRVEQRPQYCETAASVITRQVTENIRWCHERCYFDADAIRYRIAGARIPVVDHNLETSKTLFHVAFQPYRLPPPLPSDMSACYDAVWKWYIKSIMCALSTESCVKRIVRSRPERPGIWRGATMVSIKIDVATWHSESMKRAAFTRHYTSLKARMRGIDAGFFVWREYDTVFIDAKPSLSENKQSVVIVLNCVMYAFERSVQLPPRSQCDAFCRKSRELRHHIQRFECAVTLLGCSLLTQKPPRTLTSEVFNLSVVCRLPPPPLPQAKSGGNDTSNNYAIIYETLSPSVVHCVSEGYRDLYMRFAQVPGFHDGDLSFICHMKFVRPLPQPQQQQQPQNDGQEKAEEAGEKSSGDLIGELNDSIKAGVARLREEIANRDSPPKEEAEEDHCIDSPPLVEAGCFNSSNSNGNELFDARDMPELCADQEGEEEAGETETFVASKLHFPPDSYTRKQREQRALMQRIDAEHLNNLRIDRYDAHVTEQMLQRYMERSVVVTMRATDRDILGRLTERWHGRGLRCQEVVGSVAHTFRLLITWSY
jgi:hypothetical protein